MLGNAEEMEKCIATVIERERERGTQVNDIRNEKRCNHSDTVDIYVSSIPINLNSFELLNFKTDEVNNFLHLPKLNQIQID